MYCIAEVTHFLTLSLALHPPCATSVRVDPSGLTFNQQFSNCLLGFMQRAGACQDSVNR